MLSASNIASSLSVEAAPTGFVDDVAAADLLLPATPEDDVDDVDEDDAEDKEDDDDDEDVVGEEVAVEDEEVEDVEELFEVVMDVATDSANLA